MIIECPQCKAAHSKSDQELASAAATVCRRCGTSFDARGEKVAAARTESAPRVSASGKAAAEPSRELSELALDVGSGPKPGPAARRDPLGIDDLDLGIERAATKPTPSPAAPVVDELALDLGVPSKGPLAGAGSAGVALDFGESAPPAAERPSPVAGPAPEAPALGAAKPAAAASEQRARGGGSHGGWSDTPTDTARPAAPQKRLEHVRSDDDATRARPQAASTARGNVFPREAWSRFAAELGRYLRAAPVTVKLAAGAIVIVPPLLLVVLVALAGGDPAVAFVAERQPLMAGPLAGDAYEHLAPVERASRVQVYERAGELALVRDSLGRVGYVRSRSLRRDPPPAIPSQPFADCARAPVEASIDRCQTRAQEQFDSCRELCASGAEEQRCQAQCQRRFTDCNATCEQLERPAASRQEAAPKVAADQPAPALAPAPAETPRKKAKARAKRKKAH